MDERSQRKLAAIVSADVAGYSRLMGRDERGTLAALKALRSEVVNVVVADHGGRIVKTTGDGFLVEFPSVVAAVDCCAQIQDEMARRNAGVTDADAIRLRIGVHLGDVIVESDDLYGDGVNIAARLQEIAAPDGVAVSGIVHDYLDVEAARGFVDLGDLALKNIRRPVRVWQRLAGAPASHVARASSSDKPSIAVLPFDNMSGDSGQDYFADGITEDLITALTRFRRLAVTARNTSFIYKGQASDLKKVGRDLNVRYIVEGSVRRAGSRVRVTAQLIDTESGSHLWAERYDRQLADIFDLQDEITETLATTLEPEITNAEIERSRRRRSDDVTAWDLYLRALSDFHLLTQQGNERAIQHLRKAIEVDGRFVPALSLLSIAHTLSATFRWTEERRSSMQQAGQLAQAAIGIDSLDASANMAMCWYCMFNERMEESLSAARAALQSEPSLSMAQTQAAGCLSFLCRPDEALEQLRKADAMSRRDPWRWLWYMHLGNANFAAGRYDQTVAALNEGAKLRPSWRGFYTIKAAAAGMLGRDEEANGAIRQLLALIPKMSLRGVRRYPLFTSPEVVDNLLTGLRRAGLPE